MKKIDRTNVSVSRSDAFDVFYFLLHRVFQMTSPFTECGQCGLTVERSLAILKVAGSNLGRSASR